MSLLDKATPVGQVKTGTKLALYVLAFLALIGALGFVTYRVFFAGRAAKVEAVQSKTDAIVSEGNAKLGRDTLTIVREVQSDRLKIDVVTRSGENAVRSAEGADTQIPAVSSAVRHNVCMYDYSYKSNAECAAMRGDGGSIGVVGNNTGGRATE